MKKLLHKDLCLIALLLLISLAVFYFYRESLPKELYFVDAGRYADIARNLLQTGQLKTNFVFPVSALGKVGPWPINIPPLHITMIAFFFRLFGVSDSSVVWSSVFFFIATIPVLFLLTKKLFNRQAAFISSLIYLFTLPLLSYARDGASEPIFIFELILISYLILLMRSWSLLIGGIVTGLIFFTKLQSYLFIPIFLYWVFSSNQKTLKGIYWFVLGGGVIALFHVSGLLFGNFYPNIPTYLAFQQSSLFPGDNIARADQTGTVSIPFFLINLKIFLSKLFYNLYNFYKVIFAFDNLLPQFASPIIVVTYLLSFADFFQKENNSVRKFRLVVLLMFFGSLLLAAATSPQVRYVHYVLPFIIILSVGFLEKVFHQVSSRFARNVLTSILIAFFIIPFLGRVVLDARFDRHIYNPDKPYAQKALGSKLGDLTDPQGIVVTNLDSWGSWYGNRKTVLIPLDLEGFITLDRNLGIKSVYLTDYQRDNENHPLKGDWGTLFDSPDKISNRFFLEHYTLVKEGTISALEVYENKPYTFKLWMKND